MASYMGRMQMSPLIPACRKSRDREVDRSHTCVESSDSPVPKGSAPSQPHSTPCPDQCQAMVSVLISPAFLPQPLLKFEANESIERD